MAALGGSRVSWAAAEGLPTRVPRLRCCADSPGRFSRPPRDDTTPLRSGVTLKRGETSLPAIPLKTEESPSP